MNKKSRFTLITEQFCILLKLIIFLKYEEDKFHIEVTSDQSTLTTERINELILSFVSMIVINSTCNIYILLFYLEYIMYSIRPIITINKIRYVSVLLIGASDQYRLFLLYLYYTNIFSVQNFFLVQTLLLISHIDIALIIDIRIP